MIRPQPAALLFLIALCACASAGPEAAPAPHAIAASEPLVTRGYDEDAPPELATPGIAMEIRSWGRLMVSFNINGAGDVEFRETRDAESFRDFDMIIKRFHKGPEGFASLRSMVGAIEQRMRGKPIQCGQVPPDGPYGSFRWRWEGSEGALSLQFWCQTEEGGQTIALIKDVEKKVADWAASEPVTRVHQVRVTTE
jgi:hypothetical protein